MLGMFQSWSRSPAENETLADKPKRPSDALHTPEALPRYETNGKHLDRAALETPSLLCTYPFAVVYPARQTKEQSRPYAAQRQFSASFCVSGGALADPPK